MDADTFVIDPPENLRSKLDAMVLAILQTRRVSGLADVELRALGETLWRAYTCWMAIAPKVPVTIETPAWISGDAQKNDFQMAVTLAAAEMFGTYCAAWLHERLVRELELVKSSRTAGA